MRKYSSFIIIAVVGLILGVGPQFLPSYFLGLLTLVLIFSVFAMSLDLIVGYTGLPSLGHAAFFGIAGYFSGILSVKVVDTFLITIASGLAAAVICSCIFGLVVLRGRGSLLSDHYYGPKSDVMGCRLQMAYLDGWG